MCETGGNNNCGLKADGQKTGGHRKHSPAVHKNTSPLIDRVIESRAQIRESGTAACRQPAQGKDDGGADYSYHPEKTYRPCPVQALNPFHHRFKSTRARPDKNENQL